MKKSSSAVSVIGGADGPTAIFIAKKPLKLTLRQKAERLKHQIKRKYVEKTLTCESHSMDEVFDYIVNEYGFVEVDNDSDEIAEEYKQMRASFVIQYAPELLGEYAVLPELKSESKEDIDLYIRQREEQMKRAMEIPKTAFDIDFHKYEKVSDNMNDRMDITIEKKYGYIGGGASGNKKFIKKYNHIYRDVCRYYGVTEDDIKNKSERYKNLIQTLSL